jgi:type VI protein secretion system component VasK
LATQQAANRAAVLLDRDLQTIAGELEVAAPQLAIVTDVQESPGGAELVARIPLDQRPRRCGIRFAHVAPCDASQWPAMMSRGVDWVCRELLPALVYRSLTPQDNRRLYGFLAEVVERSPRLGRILQRGLALSSSQHRLLDGLYFAATGEDKHTSQAFLAGIMPQILEMQNAVAWHPAARQRDARCRHWMRAGYIALAGLVLTLATTAWLISWL